MAAVVSVNVGEVRALDWEGRTVTTAIYKRPVDGPRRLVGVNVDGDDQADRTVHGGAVKAVYVYSADDYRWWARELRRELEPGTFGENLTVEGLDPAAAVVGERWRVGGAVVRVTEPRIPCYKLGIRMGDPRFPARFADAGRPGTYLAIEQEGVVRAGDEIVVVQRPVHGVTVGMVERAAHADRGLAPRLLEAEELSERWRSWARDVVRAAQPED